MSHPSSGDKAGEARKRVLAFLEYQEKVKPTGVIMYDGGMDERPLTMEDLRELCDPSSAELHRVPAGWKLVPDEATAEMVQAAEDRQIEGASYIAEDSIQFALWREVWKAMLSAAPSVVRSAIPLTQTEEKKHG